MMCVQCHHGDLRLAVRFGELSGHPGGTAVDSERRFATPEMKAAAAGHDPKGSNARTACHRCNGHDTKDRC